jgi:ferritin-like metal-binding protein YciE
MKPELLDDIYVTSLQQALDSERLALEAMAKMEENATPELVRAFDRHRRETHEQIARLRQCLQRFEASRMRAPKPQLLAAALAEMQEQLLSGADGELAAVIVGGTAHKIENIEISFYVELIAMAKALRLEDDTRLLSDSLLEERRMERELAGFAINAVEEAAALSAQ